MLKPLSFIKRESPFLVDCLGFGDTTQSLRQRQDVHHRLESVHMMYVHTWPALWEWMEASDLILKFLLPSQTFGFSMILEAPWPCYSQRPQPVQRFLVSEVTMD